MHDTTVMPARGSRYAVAEIGPTDPGCGAHHRDDYTVATRDLVRRRHPLAVTFGILLVAAVFTKLLYLAIPGLALGQWF